MKLHDRSAYAAPLTKTMSVWGAKVGRQFDAMELDATDVDALMQLAPAKLKDWLGYWQLGFRLPTREGEDADSSQ